jgi:hypothetical protein
MNGVPPALRAVKEENLAMTVELNPVEWGRLGVDVLATFSRARRSSRGVHQARHHRQDQHRRETAED